MRSWYRWLGLGACCVLATVLSGCGQAAVGNSASCAAPVLTTRPHAHSGDPGPRVVTAAPGQELRIYGFGYATCHDTNHQAPSRPFKHLAVLITQGHTKQTLAYASPSVPGGTFKVTIHLPGNLRKGSATLHTTSQVPEEPLQLNIRTLASGSGA